MISYAERILADLEKIKKPEKSSWTMKASPHKGLRCHTCGRMLPRVKRLPAVRTCVNTACRQTYHITRGPEGITMQKVDK